MGTKSALTLAAGDVGIFAAILDDLALALEALMAVGGLRCCNGLNGDCVVLMMADFRLVTGVAWLSLLLLLLLSLTAVGVRDTAAA